MKTLTEAIPQSEIVKMILEAVRVALENDLCYCDGGDECAFHRLRDDVIIDLDNAARAALALMG